MRWRLIFRDDFGAMASPAITITQFDDLWRRRGDYVSPEIALLWSFLGRNLRDFLIGKKARRGLEHQLGAKLWFQSKSQEPFSFDYVCQHVGIRREVILQGIAVAGQDEIVRNRLLHVFDRS